ncbi:MAG: signal transduction histidine kinase [bacterium]|jgi:signal transduction histidine kinase
MIISSVTEASSNDCDKKRILVVDDTESIHEAFTKILSSVEHKYAEDLDQLASELWDEPRPNHQNKLNLNFQLDHASQGKDALEMVRVAHEAGQPYSVIFMDIRMPPGWDGIKTIAKIWEEFSDVEVVICTAYSDFSLEEVIERLGRSDQLMFMKKPFDHTAVIQMALSLSQKWDLARKNRKHVEELEAAVTERTEALEYKNQELEQTLKNLQNAQTQLVESEKMAALGNLVAGIAHEVNTPIGIGVTAVTNLKKQSAQISDKYKSQKMKRSDLETFLDVCVDHCDSIYTNLYRASGLIASFKQVAVDQTSEERRSFNLKEYLHEIILSLQPQIRKTNHILDVEGGNQIVIDSYPGSFSQIVTNFVVNSLTHGFENGASGRMLLKFEVEEQYLFLTYSDNGVGIGEGNLKKIFDPFFTTKRGAGGTGLGMHIVYNIVTQKLNGSVSCESEINNGTKFHVKIPVKLTNT